MRYFLSLLLTCIISLSCSKEKSCKKTASTYIYEVNSPEETTVNQLTNLDLSLILNGCDYFYKLESKGEFEREITAKITQETCLYCTTSITETIVTYSFLAKKPGTYILKFKSSSNTHIEKQIVVK
ncbi:hypothetical protein Pedsa_3836 [Pseudopedobacter saltans DSM 12145]|uniref:Uncharacterized protein n=1 Tax=Pseudopedobacter saltans (strain ATCC 51119 / DSM 12145 / JCM 21818 / CCUG 39354 / LMG 10337 / NBRC 100064 / NCIMB 13643) TaxID=762903 RepID=F0S791_PSESL|nr:hypothetical protein [Pseudopedobacter saltans]ADY54364.1 hypothetical protein Pedsa_3836 [Pseudopedobacter saltans DSM 12145]